MIAWIFSIIIVNIILAVFACCILSGKISREEEMRKIEERMRIEEVNKNDKFKVKR